ncbi:hypothetical protein [Radicibacter daui]|uniref:hypothetical protein n=1 Tax=Radicibacter daui TaxID=3064829 RepID=UPI004046F5E8
MPAKAIKPAWAALLLLHAAFAVWLLHHPPGLGSDDALFFANGLSRFSLAEFSPHFPGYPGFILLGRFAALLTGDAAAALRAVTLISTLSLPAAAAWCAAGFAPPDVRQEAAFSGWLLVLLLPLAPVLALSQLSDPAGLLFLLLALACAVRGRAFTAGLLLGVAFCCRPSYAPVMAALALAALVLDWRQGLRLIAGAALIALPAYGVVIVKEGPFFFEEALRFTEGHVTVWGHTAFSADSLSWRVALGAIPGALLLASLSTFASLWALAGADPQARWRRALVMLWAVGTFWSLLMQNPDNLRHMALPLLLALLLAASLPGAHARRSFTSGLLTLQAAIWLLAVNPATFWAAPLDAAVRFLSSEPPGAVATNYGVELLRAELPEQRIYDAWYAAHAAEGLRRAGGGWRLTGTKPLADRHAASFPGRFPGERSLWLYREP